MLSREYAVGEPVVVRNMGIGNTFAEGVIKEVRDAGKPYVTYVVAWNDGKYPDEIWGPESLDTPTGPSLTHPSI
jgi:hypothetical protein